MGRWDPCLPQGVVQLSSRASDVTFYIDATRNLSSECCLGMEAMQRNSYLENP